MKYEIRERNEYFTLIDYFVSNKKIGFVEIYKNGLIYTSIYFNGEIKLLKKILKIANKERIKTILFKRYK